MTWNRYHLKCIAAILFTVPFALSPVHMSAQQSETAIGPKSKLMETRVGKFQLENETLLDGLWKLARGPVPFGFGFEKVLKTRLSDQDLPEPFLNIQLKDKSFREIFDALCKADPRYTWSDEGNFVNFFPRAITNDPTYLLNRRLPKFELKNATDVQNGLLAIHVQLPPPDEQIAQAQVGGDDPYPPEPWTVTLQNVTVRQVVNRLALHGGPYGIWIFGGARDFRSFGFFNTHPSPWLQKIIDSRPKSPQSRIEDERF